MGDFNPEYGMNRYYPVVPFIVQDLDEYELSPSARDEIFSRGVRPVTNRDASTYEINSFALTGGHDNFLDTENEYHLNSLKYRSTEFSSEVDFVYAGCSYSFGEGSAEEDIWGSKVANHFGYSYSNLSRPGASVQWIVKNLFNYFREYGHPKVLACLFPDFCRISIPVNPRISRVKGNNADDSWTTMHDSHLGAYVELSDRPKYSKKPHALEDVLPVELPMSLSVEYISMLSRYCETNNIKFYWATWDLSASIFMKEAADQYGYPEYLDLKNEQWHDRPEDDFYQYFHKDASKEDVINNCYSGECKYTDCHVDLKNKHGRYFYIGSDVDWVGGPSAHWGAHRHAHAADAFIEVLTPV